VTNNQYCPFVRCQKGFGDHNGTAVTDNQICFLYATGNQNLKLLQLVEILDYTPDRFTICLCSPTLIILGQLQALEFPQKYQILSVKLKYKSNLQLA